MNRRGRARKKLNTTRKRKEDTKDETRIERNRLTKRLGRGYEETKKRRKKKPGRARKKSKKTRKRKGETK